MNKPNNNQNVSQRAVKIAAIIVVAAVAVFVIVRAVMGIVWIVRHADNSTLDFEEIAVFRSEDIGGSVRIVHLSDLHFPRLSVCIDELVEGIGAANPHIIAITGDIIDTRTELWTSGVLEFVERIVAIAPVYYVSGNHELANPNTVELFEGLVSRGVIMLDNEHRVKDIDGIAVTVIGISDNAHYTYDAYNKEDISDSLVILLAHRPNNRTWNSATNNPYVVAPDLILAGHIHGGQIRIWGRGLLCPDTLLLPRFSSGLYESGNDRGSRMVVSRGIGNSIVPIRINSLPHVPVITVWV